MLYLFLIVIVDINFLTFKIFVWGLVLYFDFIRMLGIVIRIWFLGDRVFSYGIFVGEKKGKY